MTEIIYGKSLSREGKKHVGRTPQMSRRSSATSSRNFVAAGNSNLSASRNTDVDQLDKSLIEAESEFNELRRNGIPRVVDGDIVWEVPAKEKRARKAVKVEEHDKWRAEKPQKAPKLSDKLPKRACSAKGNTDTKDRTLSMGRNRSDAHLGPLPLACNLNRVPVPDKVYDAEREAFIAAMQRRYDDTGRGKYVPKF